MLSKLICIHEDVLGAYICVLDHLVPKCVYTILVPGPSRSPELKLCSIAEGEEAIEGELLYSPLPVRCVLVYNSSRGLV